MAMVTTIELDQDLMNKAALEDKQVQQGQPIYMARLVTALPQQATQWCFQLPLPTGQKIQTECLMLTMGKQDLKEMMAGEE